MRTLFLMRHAQAQNVAFGSDRERPLTSAGRRDAAAAGATLREQDIQLVWCSSAVRTRQTLDSLSLPDTIRVEFLDYLYVCGTNTLLKRIGEVGEEITRLLVIGHSPTIPGLAARLASGANPHGAERLWADYPTATWSQFGIDGTWDELARMPYALARLERMGRGDRVTPGPLS